MKISFVSFIFGIVVGWAIPYLFKWGDIVCNNTLGKGKEEKRKTKHL